MLNFFGSINDTTDRYFHVLSSDLEVIERKRIKMSEKGYSPSVSKFSNGSFLISSGRKHLIRFDTTGNIQVLPNEEYIVEVFIDQKDGAWISSTDGVEYYKKGAITKKNKKTFFENTNSIVFCNDFQNGIWFYSEKNGINRIAFPAYDFYSEEKFYKGKNLAYIEVIDDEIYLAGQGSQCYVLNQESGHLDSFKLPIKQRYPIDFINDRNNRLWVSERGALYYREKEDWKELDKKKLTDLYGLTRIYLKGKTTVDSISFISWILRRSIFLFK